MSTHTLSAGGAVLLAAVLATGQPSVALHCEPWISPTGEHIWDRHGSSVCFGDIDGDGHDDIIVGAHLADGGGDDAGRVWVYLGGPTPDATPDLVLDGEGEVNHFGVSVFSGDLDGDGYDDILVGAQECDLDGPNAGRAYLFRGGAAPDATPDLIYPGLAAGDWHGCSVSMGDLDGDGHLDAIVGARMQGGGPGKAVVYLGGAMPDNDPDLVVVGELHGDQFGTTVACVGDLDADGCDDFLVGARFNDAGGPDAGRVYVYLGGAPLDPVPDLVITGTPGARLGAGGLRYPGDWNGDGHDDIVLGDYLHPGGGRALVFLGSSSPDADVDVIIPATNPALRLGHFVSFAGDLTGNGHDDLLLGATSAVEYGLEPAAVYVHAGGPDLDPVADHTLAGEPGEGFGSSVTAAGDVNGDGHRDLAVGAIWWANNTGRTHVFTCRPTRVWYVPADAPTIQAGIDSADVGDKVVVACGTYLEHDLVMKSSITLRSEDGRADCVTIDAQQLGRVMSGAELDAATVVAGFTFTGGQAAHGGGFRGADCELTIADCVVTANVADLAGGGLFLEGGAPTLVNVTVAANQAAVGGGLRLVACPADLRSTLVAFNLGESISCAVGVPELSCCDLFGNTAGDWIGPFVDQVVVRGNFGADPCFCGLAAGHLALCADSFCLPGHHPWGCDDLVGALGAGCDACDCAGPVPCRLTWLTAALDGDVVVVRWRVSSPGVPADFRVVARGEGDQWSLPVDQAADGTFAAVDRRAAALGAGTVAYCLSWRTDDGRWDVLAEETVQLTAAALSLSLLPGCPNPSNPQTTLEYFLPRSGRAELAVYAVDGRRVITLLDAESPAGRHAVEWDGRDAAGRPVRSGVYLVRLVAAGRAVTGKVTIVR